MPYNNPPREVDGKFVDESDDSSDENPVLRVWREKIHQQSSQVLEDDICDLVVLHQTTMDDLEKSIHRETLLSIELLKMKYLLSKCSICAFCSDYYKIPCIIPCGHTYW